MHRRGYRTSAQSTTIAIGAEATVYGSVGGIVVHERLRVATLVVCGLMLTCAVSGCSTVVDKSVLPSKPVNEASSAVAPMASNGSSAIPASESVTVPDFCALGGGIEVSPAAVSPEPIWYADPKRLSVYRKIAVKAGVRVEFVPASSYGEEWWGGQAGWPRGQEPEPGATVPRGSVVKLVVSDEAASNAAYATTGPDIVDLVNDTEMSGNAREQLTYGNKRYAIVVASDALSDTWAVGLYRHDGDKWMYLDAYATTWNAFSEKALLRWVSAEYPEFPVSLVEMGWDELGELPN